MPQFCKWCCLTFLLIFLIVTYHYNKQLEYGKMYWCLKKDMEWIGGDCRFKQSTILDELSKACQAANMKFENGVCFAR